MGKKMYTFNIKEEDAFEETENICEMFGIELDDIINEFLVQFVSGFRKGMEGE